MADFAVWLGSLLGRSEQEVARLIGDKSAFHFLIAWSLFESKCFAGYLKADAIQPFAVHITGNSILLFQELRSIAEHFHGRYQNKKLLKNLLYEHQGSALQALLEKPFTSLVDVEVVFLVVFVVFRFRNNIFHGNKGVSAWLRFKEQIELCTRAMQVFVTHAEALHRTMRTPEAA